MKAIIYPVSSLCSLVIGLVLLFVFHQNASEEIDELLITSFNIDAGSKYWILALFSYLVPGLLTLVLTIKHWKTFRKGFENYTTSLLLLTLAMLWLSFGIIRFDPEDEISTLNQIGRSIAAQVIIFFLFLFGTISTSNYSKNKILKKTMILLVALYILCLILMFSILEVYSFYMLNFIFLLCFIWLILFAKFIEERDSAKKTPN